MKYVFITTWRSTYFSLYFENSLEINKHSLNYCRENQTTK